MVSSGPTRQAPPWTSSQASHIWIFNVERGLAIFIRTPLNHGIIYDFGCTEDFDPFAFLGRTIVPHLTSYKDAPIAQSIISHPHADHISGIKCLEKPSAQESPFRPALLTCPHDKTVGPAQPEALDWSRIENPEWSNDEIDTYKRLLIKRNPPLQTITYDKGAGGPALTTLAYGVYYVRPPVVGQIFAENDQEYANGLSLVLYYRHGDQSILIPGDINPETLKHILSEKPGHEKRFSMFDGLQANQHPDWHLVTGTQPSLRSLLSNYGLTILVAPHHGLESCYSEDLYRVTRWDKPRLVVISESRKVSETQGSTDARYQSAEGASGLRVSIDGVQEDCFSVSTKNKHHILINFKGTGSPSVFLDSNPYKLIDHMQ